MSAQAGSKNSVTLRITRRLHASPERVFDAWLDPKIAGTFLFATPAGTMVKAEIDARVGGQFLFVDRRDGEDIGHSGTYLEIVRPKHLAFSFYVPKYQKADEKTIVRLDFAAIHEGCEVTLTHEGVWPDYEERTKKGWSMILEKLATVLAA